MMEVMANDSLPGDPRLIDRIVYELKSQGIFDQFRKECIADVDTKPAYQNLRQRVEGSVTGFLRKQIWKPDMNKNQVREMLRKNIYESGFLETGVERIVDQVVNPKINSIFLPQVEDVVYRFLGIEKPNRNNENRNIRTPLKINIFENLLPTDLEAVSPESETNEKKVDKLNDSLEVENKIDEDESPPFEPLDGQKPNISHEENSVDSHLSGFSGLMSHDSNHSQDMKLEHEISNQDSQLSKQSSDGHMSISMSDDSDTKMETAEETDNLKTMKSVDSNSEFGFSHDFERSSEIHKSDNNSEHLTDIEKSSDVRVGKHETPKSEIKKTSKNRNSEKHKSHDRVERKEEKDRKSDIKDKKDSKERHSNSKDSKNRERSKDKRDSKSNSKNEKSEKDKESRREKDIKNGKEGSNRNDKEKDKDRSRSSGKHSSSKDKDRSSSKGESSSREKSSESKDKVKSSSSHKHKDSKSKERGEEKNKNDTKSDKKDDKNQSRSGKHSSSSRRDKKCSRKDPKRDVKDDHFSSKTKRSSRRSTDRDSNDGHSGTKSSTSSLIDSLTSSQTQKQNEQSSQSNSGSGDSGNSDSIEHTSTQAMEYDHFKNSLSPVDNIQQQIKIIKPKFASNIYEARRLQKIRKELGKIERRNQQLAIESVPISSQLSSEAEEQLTDLGSENLTEKDDLKSECVVPPLIIEIPEALEPAEPVKPLSPALISPPLQNSVITKESWDALEAKLNKNHINTNYNEYFDYSEYDEDLNYESAVGVKSSNQKETELNKMVHLEEEKEVEKDVLCSKISDNDDAYITEEIDCEAQVVVESARVSDEANESYILNEPTSLTNDIKDYETNIDISKITNCSDSVEKERFSPSCLCFEDSMLPVTQRYMNYASSKIKVLEESIKMLSSNMESMKTQLNVKTATSLKQNSKHHLSETCPDIKNNNTRAGGETVKRRKANLKVNNDCKMKRTKIIDATDLVQNGLFSFPLSPAGSENSDKKIAGKDQSSLKQTPKTKTQRYSSDDLYKPRPLFSGSRRRATRSTRLD